MATYWEQGICSCFNDCTTCIITFLFPCYMAGMNAEAVGENYCPCAMASVCCPYCLCSRTYVRGRIRDSKGIRGSAIADCCLILWCCMCTICQEAQEVRSINPTTIVRK